IKESADFCTIIRAGKYIDTVDVDTVDENDLASMMVGRKVTFTVDKPQMTPGPVVLHVENLHGVDYRGVEILKGLNLDVHAGEIVGIAGIDGNGQTELVEILTGLRKATQGEATVNGVSIYNKSPNFGFNHGVSSIPADRQKHGLVLDFSIEDNLILQNYASEPFAKSSILQREPIFSHATSSIEQFDIRPHSSEKRPAGTLSGGNQQKVVIAREVQNDKDLLIAVNPTRGLDVGAIEYVHKYIVDQRNKGKAVLLVSFELDEIMSLSDVIDVIFDGQIVSSIPGGEANENDLGLMMAGGNKK
ncbi:MAG: ATP-binding cassette domain-containing protein, partial [Clostridia bacterium]|nr:ATP-binding cassette domain-containing protein [Clostridia bacterium]